MDVIAAAIYSIVLIPRSFQNQFDANKWHFCILKIVLLCGCARYGLLPIAHIYPAVVCFFIFIFVIFANRQHKWPFICIRIYAEKTYTRTQPVIQRLQLCVSSDRRSKKLVCSFSSLLTCRWIIWIFFCSSVRMLGYFSYGFHFALCTLNRIPLFLDDSYRRNDQRKLL